MFTIGRGLRNFGDGQYVGVLVTDTEFQSRLQPRDRRGYLVEAWRSVSLEREHDRERVGDASSSDSATATGGQLTYSYDTRRVAVSGQVEHYSSDFRMDTAFINRVGITRAWQYQGLSFYPDEKRYPWLKRVNPFVWVTAADDRIQGGSELQVIPAIRFNFTRQGYLRLDVLRGHETFAHAGSRWDACSLMAARRS